MGGLVPDGQTFPEPAHVGVFCGMYSSRPPNDETFHGWGWNRTNWPGTDQGCTFETRHAYGEESCTDYFRAQHDQVQITAPWCRTTFTYAAPVTLNARIVTYCVTR